MPRPLGVPCAPSPGGAPGPRPLGVPVCPVPWGCPCALSPGGAPVPCPLGVLVPSPGGWGWVSTPLALPGDHHVGHPCLWGLRQLERSRLGGASGRSKVSHGGHAERGSVSPRVDSQCQELWPRPPPLRPWEAPPSPEPPAQSPSACPPLLPGAKLHRPTALGFRGSHGSRPTRSGKLGAAGPPPGKQRPRAVVLREAAPAPPCAWWGGTRVGALL